MALQSVQQASNLVRGNLQTQATKFDLFEVRAGMPAHDALSQASCLADSLKKLANAQASGMNSEATYFVAFVAEVIHALIESVQHDIEFSE